MSRYLRREPTQARSRALVESVLGAFDQMLRSFGDERDVTIERLVERAGVGIGSFYEYFVNKDSLVGALVERTTRANFNELLAGLDAVEHPDLSSEVAAVASAVTEVYLRHPARTRMLVTGVGRLGLMPVIVAERDQFARELARRAARFEPDASPLVLEAAMRQVADAAVGVLTAELYRPARPLAAVAAELTAQAQAILRARLG